MCSGRAGPRSSFAASATQVYAKKVYAKKDGPAGQARG
jgi:hypothetical protein